MWIILYVHTNIHTNSLYNINNGIHNHLILFAIVSIIMKLAILDFDVKKNHNNPTLIITNILK